MPVGHIQPGHRLRRQRDDLRRPALVHSAAIHHERRWLLSDAVGMPDYFVLCCDHRWGHRVFNGTTWTAGAAIDWDGAAQSLSCASRRFCAAADLTNKVTRFDGTSWSVPTVVDPAGEVTAGLSTMSCAPGRPLRGLRRTQRSGPGLSVRRTEVVNGANCRPGQHSAGCVVCVGVLLCRRRRHRRQRDRLQRNPVESTR